MSDRSQMLYLLHAERRLLDQVFKRRNHRLGLSWEAALPWVQEDPDRINRLVEQKILQTEGDSLRLSTIIQIFWEQWEAEDMSLYSWAELRADWRKFQTQILENEQLPASSTLQSWVKQLQIWQRFLLSLSWNNLAVEQQNWVKQAAQQIKSKASQRLGLDQSLDRQMVLLLDRLQDLSQSQMTNENKSELFLQITRLQALKRKDLLFEQTDLEVQLQSLEATLWNAKPNPALWPSLRANP